MIGYAGVDNKGLGGLEVEYDRKLSGPSGQADDRPRPVRPRDRRDQLARRSSEGSDVFTTIDHTIQANAEAGAPRDGRDVGREGGDGDRARPDDRRGARDGAGARLRRERHVERVPSTLQRNRAVTDTYEPGSTFKLVTVTGGALARASSRPTRRSRCRTRSSVADRVVHDAEPRRPRRCRVAQILSHSSNVGAITLAEKLGATALASWIDRFGFGQPTGIDFPGESPGFVLPLDQWSGSTIGNVPIGQGIAVTPIQMASVYAAVANDGVWVQPHLVERVGGRAPVQLDAAADHVARTSTSR